MPEKASAHIPRVQPSVLNLMTFHTRFPDEDACYTFIVEQRWPEGVACLNCGSVKVYVCHTRRLFKCKDCNKQFSALVNTIFQDTHLSLRKWFMAVYLNASDGISSVKLAKLIGVTQKTAWFLSQRILHAMEDDDIILHGLIQIDEVYIGPVARGRSSARYSKKYAILGAVEGGQHGRLVTAVVKQPDTTVATGFINKYISPGSHIYSDESRIYNSLKYRYPHDSINHSQKQYVHNGVTTNKIENNWAHTKRLLRGRHIKVSGKHLSTYVSGGYQFRYNTRHLTDIERMQRWLKQSFGKVLTYKQLLAKRATQPLALRGWARKRAAMPVQMSLFN